MNISDDEILVAVGTNLLYRKVSVLEPVNLEASNFKGKYHILASEKIILGL